VIAKTLFEQYDSRKIAELCGVRQLSYGQMAEVMYAWDYVSGANKDPEKYFDADLQVGKTLVNAGLIASLRGFTQSPPLTPEQTAALLIKIISTKPTPLATGAWGNPDFDYLAFFKKEHIIYAAAFKKLNKLKKFEEFWGYFQVAYEYSKRDDVIEANLMELIRKMRNQISFLFHRSRAFMPEFKTVAECGNYFLRSLGLLEEGNLYTLL
jgi:hypothetical protein